MRTLIFFFALTSSAFAYEQTDYTCLNGCTGKGYAYNMCKSKCTYETNPAPANVRTDYQCQSDCTNAGGMYQYCKQKCSY